MTRILVLAVACLALACNSEPGATTKAQENADKKNSGEKVTIDGLTSRVPKNWINQKPSNRLRAFQFKIPKVKGDPKDAEMVIFYFGPGGGGSVEANLRRWKGQFKAPKGKSIEDVSNVKKFKVSKVPVTYLDVQGTYLYKFPPFAPNAKVTPLPNYRSLGVIFASEKGPYFIRLTGPAKTVAENKAGFDTFLKSFK